MNLSIILLASAGLLACGFLALVAGRSRLATPLVYGLSLVCLVPAMLAGLCHILGMPQPVETAVLPLGLPWMPMHARLDGLSAFFLTVVSFIGALASLYGLSYGKHEEESGRVLPFFPLFMAGMLLVTVANDAFTFLIAWEFMSISSWFLVLTRHREKATQHAAFVYLIMAFFSTLALLLAFGLMAGTGGDYTFDAIRAHGFSPMLATAIMALALIGAGAKAGVVPLHVWLPLAHPAAPSHVSALMSGVMTKVAIYGLVRILFDLIGVTEGWWGGVIMAVGGVTAVMGVLYALMQHDLKKLLAYHTVENIGIIVIGLGLSVAFRAHAMPVLAGLALTAALFHVLNHAVFKSLLFFGAGNVLTATGQRDMEKMGGLIQLMPVTAFAFLIGSAAISALPPFNGFISEWLTFQAILGGSSLPSWGLKFLVPVVGALLALAAALAAVCFVKVYGVVFLGRARSTDVTGVKEVDRLMLAPLVILAALCAVIGLFPSLVLGLVQPVVAELMPGAPLPFEHTSWLVLVPLKAEGSSYSGLIILLATTTLALALTAAIHRFASHKSRRSAPWDCGFPGDAPDSQYTASSFAQPIRRVFGTTLFAAKDMVDMPRPGETRDAHFQVRLRDPVWDFGFAPLEKLVSALSRRLDVAQFFSIRRYLTIMFVSLVLLLIIVAVMQ